MGTLQPKAFGRLRSYLYCLYEALMFLSLGEIPSPSLGSERRSSFKHAPGNTPGLACVNETVSSSCYKVVQVRKVPVEKPLCFHKRPPNQLCLNATCCNHRRRLRQERSIDMPWVAGGMCLSTIREDETNAFHAEFELNTSSEFELAMLESLG